MILLMLLYMAKEKGYLSDWEFLVDSGLCVFSYGCFLIHFNVAVAVMMSGMSLTLIMAGFCRKSYVGIEYQRYMYQFYMTFAFLLVGLQFLTCGLSGVMWALRFGHMLNLMAYLACYSLIAVGVVVSGVAVSDCFLLSEFSRILGRSDL